MIMRTVRGNIFETECRHIAFAVSAEGNFTRGGVALAAIRRCWPDLRRVGASTLGTAHSKCVGDITYHALVCHTWQPGGWVRTPEHVTSCLDSLNVPDDEEIAIVHIGTGQREGTVDTSAVLECMERSGKMLVIYNM